MQTIEHAEAIASLAPGRLNTKKEEIRPESGSRRRSARHSSDALSGSSVNRLQAPYNRVIERRQ
jgi:hypothetical protein